MQTLQLKNYRSELLLIGALSLPLVLFVLQKLIDVFFIEDYSLHRLSTGGVYICGQVVYMILFGLVALLNRKPLVLIGYIIIVLGLLLGISHKGILQWIIWCQENSIDYYFDNVKWIGLIRSLLLAGAYLFKIIGYTLFYIALDVRKGFKVVLLVALVGVPLLGVVYNIALQLFNLYEYNWHTIYFYAVQFINFILLVAGVLFSGIFSKKQVA